MAFTMYDLQTGEVLGEWDDREAARYESGKIIDRMRAEGSIPAGVPANRIVEVR